MNKPKRIEGRFKCEHKEFGELEIDMELNQDNLIVLAMRKLLKTKSLKARLWGGTVSAELSRHSKLRVKAISRLRGAPKEPK